MLQRRPARPTVLTPSWPRRPDDLPAAARRQAGVFTTAQAVGEGWTPRQVERRLATGRWRRVTAGALAVAGGEIGAESRAWAVRLRWPDAVVAQRTAALLWDLPVHDDGLAHVRTARGRTGRGVAVHGVPLDPADVVRLPGGHRATSRRRTILDCLAELPLDEALDLHAWTATRRLLPREDLLDELKARFGRPGATQLRRLVVLTRTGAVSSAEHRMHALFRDRGVTGWRAGVRVEDRDGVIGVVDLLFAAERVVVEVDGERAHSGRKAFVRDRQRQNRLVNAGYRVLRFTWWDLVERPDAVVAEVRRALALA